MRLTKLQRLGISEILRDYMIRIDYSIIKGGKITFKNDSRGEFTHMFADGYNKRTLCLFMDENENIDDTFTYEFQWVSDDGIFHIIDIEDEKGDEINGVS